MLAVVNNDWGGQNVEYCVDFLSFIMAMGNLPQIEWWRLAPLVDAESWKSKANGNNAAA